MKLSKQTLDILNSFTSINNGVIIHKGSRIRIGDNLMKLFAYADIVDEFPMQFGIYDLGEFLSAINLVEGADLNFEEEFVTISNVSTRLKYAYSEESYLKEPPEVLKFPDTDDNIVKFNLTSENLERVRKACSTLGFDYISVSTVAGSTDISLSAISLESRANKFDIVLEDVKASLEGEYCLIFKAERLSPILKQDYEVSISPRGISRFVGNNIEYFATIETESKFTKL